MYDRTNYVNEKIINRLGCIGEDKENVSNLLNEFKNIDLTPSYGDNFDSSVIGWIKASKMIASLLEKKLPLTKENFINEWAPTVQPPAISRGEAIVDDEILNRPPPSLDFLLSISTVDDIAKDFDYSSLTEEGLRNAGFVDKDDTTLDATELVCREDFKTVTVQYDATSSIRNELEIVSPYSGTTDVYKIDSNTYMDLETDKIFKVVYSESEESSASSNTIE